MRLAAYEVQGRPGVGLVENGEIFDLTSAWKSLPGVKGNAPASLVELIRRLDGDTRALAAAVHLEKNRDHPVPLSAVRIGAPIPFPGKLLCVGSNYAAHNREAGRDVPEDPTKVTPWLFLKPPTTIIGPGVPIPFPRIGQAVDWEIELAAVIGRRAKDVAAKDALDYVFGYTVVNDISERRFKAPAGRPAREWDKFFDWLYGKWFDGFAPMGPFLVTADEVGDPQALSVRLWVNGRLRQNGNTREMIYSVADLIAFASTIMTLEPGDVIATGTPEGVGNATGDFLQPGDLVEGEVERVGRLKNHVVR